MIRVPTLLSWCTSILSFVGLTALANAQDIKGTIKHTKETIVIDGNGDDAAWASANELSDFFTVAGEDPTDDADLSAKWRGLWDENNLYFWIEVSDEEVITEDTNDWKDDGVEIYIDAEARGKGDDPLGDYRPGVNGDFGPPEEGELVPVYQLTIHAGSNEIFNGINHRTWVELHPDLELGEETTWEHQGAGVKTDTGYVLEIALPWESLGSSGPIDIINRGVFGLGIAMNDKDVAPDRQSQIMWATEMGDLWNNPTSFPDAALEFPDLPGPDIAITRKIDLGVLSAAEPSFTRTIPVTNFGSDNALSISGVTVSGPDAALVTVDSFPASVGTRGTEEIAMTFTPGRTGEFDFTLEVASDDVDEADKTKSVQVTATVFNFAGPAAHFTLDEEAGAAELRDITGFGNHGTFEGGTPGQEGLATGTSASFDGSTYASFESALAPESFSASLWLNADAFSSTQLLVGQGSPSFALMLSGGQPAWFADGDIEFLADGVTLNVGETNHIAATYDASGDSPVVKIFVNGQPVTIQSDAVEIALDADTWWIGAFNGSLGFDGRIDDVQIYDRALSDEEVLGIFETPGVGGVPGSIDAGIDVSGLSDVTGPGDDIVLVSGTNDDDNAAGDPPAAEGVENAINDVGQKYLNFLDLGSGFIVTPASGNTVVSAIRLYTANDEPPRDPGSFRLEGGNSADGPFSVIAEGLLDLPDDRNDGGDTVLDPETSANQLVTFVNEAPYASYRLTFPALKDAGNANSMQIAEVELLGVAYTPPTPVIAYDFNEGSGTAIGNSGGGAAGELVNAHAGAWVASGGPDGSGYLNFTQDGATGAESQHILTKINAVDIPVSGDVNYTMMAWARFDEWTPPGADDDDRMIFGQLDGNVLHNGARGSNFHMGHWGNDTNGGSVTIGEWQHLTWHYQDGVQRILVNGEVVAEGEDKGALAVEDEIIIGTTRGDQDRDFSGDLDDVRIYNEALPISVIQGIIAEASGGGGGGGGEGGDLGGLTGVGLGADGFTFTLGEGASGTVEFSTDLIEWVPVAADITGPFSDNDADRLANPQGYYRVSQ